MPVKPNLHVEVKPVWRPDRLSSILRLWLEIIKSRSKIMHFNIHLAVFGRSRAVNFLGLMSVAVARLSMKKVIVTLHNISEGIRLDVVGMSSLLNRIGLTIATKIILSSAHAAVVLVKRYVGLLRKRYKVSNVLWVPHGAWFTEAPAAWRFHDGKPRILFLGYLSPYKDLKTLSDAVKEVGGELIISSSPHPNFMDEGRRALIHVLREGHVKYLGYVENSRLPKLVSNVSVVALPYATSTGTSGVVHLLSGLGAPFIAFATEELKELMEEGAGILLVEASKDALKEGIKAATSRQLAEELSRRSRSFALSRSWRRVAEAYLNLYAALLKKP
jgi:glycosyltransferase involved in cell wall biosynthesis